MSWFSFLCCNYERISHLFPRFVSCKTVDRKLKKEMWLTVKDRLRIPYPGGARPLFCESFLPLFIILFRWVSYIYFVNNLMYMQKKFTHCSQLTAAINVYSTCIVCILLILVLFYARRKYQRGNQRTNFYFYWFSWSVAYLLVLFQTNVPIMEVLPEENLLFIVLLTLMLICFYMVSPSVQSLDTLLLSICIILGSSS